MACPTCNHSMSTLSLGDEHGNGTVRWCERCGTVRVSAGSTHETYTPKLVDRVRRLRDEAPLSDTAARLWVSLGIAESIDPPGKRKETL